MNKIFDFHDMFDANKTAGIMTAFEGDTEKNLKIIIEHKFNFKWCSENPHIKKNCEFILNNPPALEEEFEYHGRLLAAVPDHSDNQYHHERMLQNVPSVINVDSL